MNLDAKRYAPRAIASLISQAKNELMGPADYLNQAKDQFQEIVAQVFAIYQKRLTGANSMDFDDLIAKTVEVLQRYPDARSPIPRLGVLIIRLIDTSSFGLTITRKYARKSLISFRS